MGANSEVRRKKKQILAAVLGYGLMLVVLLRFLWMLLASFQPEADLITLPPFPFRPTTFYLDNYQIALSYKPFTNAILTSITLALLTTGLVMAAGALGAYALARLRFRGRETIFKDIMVIYMLAELAMLIPLVIVMKILGLLDSVAGLIMAHTVYILPLMTWFLVGIFWGVPTEIEEAAKIDGRSKMGTLFRVIIPLSISGFFLITVFCFVLSWNQLMFAKVVAIFRVKMLQLAIFEFLSPTTVTYSTLAAASMISSLPVVLLAIILQRYIIARIPKGAVK